MRTSVLLSLAAGLAAALSLTSAARPGEDKKVLDVGDTIPAETMLRDVDGKEHRFGDLRGKIVVLDFWSISCPVSVAYEERFKAFHADLQKMENVVLLAIDANATEVDLEAEDPYARIKAYRKKAEVRFPVLVDLDNVLADRLGAQTTPHVYVLDKEGVIRYQGSFDDEAKPEKVTKQYARDAVDALRRGEKPPVERTKAFGCSIKRKKSA